MSKPHVVFDLLFIDLSEVARNKSIVNRRQCDAQSARDNDVRASSDKLSVQMVEVVRKTSLHDRLVGLCGKNLGILIFLGQINLVNVLDRVSGLELVCAEGRLDVKVFTLALVVDRDSIFVLLVAQAKERIKVSEILRFVLLVSILKDLVMAG